MSKDRFMKKINISKKYGFIMILAMVTLLSQCKAAGEALSAALTYYNVSGQIDGFDGSAKLTLKVNGTTQETLTLTPSSLQDLDSDGWKDEFRFDYSFNGGETYQIEVTEQPTVNVDQTQRCEVIIGSGTVNDNINNAWVICETAADSYENDDSAANSDSVYTGGKAVVYDGTTQNHSLYVVSQDGGDEGTLTGGTDNPSSGGSDTNMVIVDEDIIKIVVGAGDAGDFTFKLTGMSPELDADFELYKDLSGSYQFVTGSNVGLYGQDETFTTSLTAATYYLIVYPATYQTSSGNLFWGQGFYNLSVKSSANASVTAHSVSADVSGLNGLDITMTLNRTDQTFSIDSDPKTVTFSNTVAEGEAYSVSVKSIPSNKQCSVTNGTGTIGTSSPTNVTVSCSDKAATLYTVGGAASLSSQTPTITMTGSGINTQSVTLGASDTSYSLPTSVPDGTYTLSISAVSGYNCLFNSNSQATRSVTVSSTNVTNADMTCTVIPGGGCTADATINANNTTHNLVATPITTNGSKTVCVEGTSLNHSVYAVYTNVGSTKQTLSDGSGSGSTASMEMPPIMSEYVSDGGYVSELPDYINDFENNLPYKGEEISLWEQNKEMAGYSAGTVDSTTRNWYYSNNTSQYATTTLRAQGILGDSKLLKIWVANDMWTGTTSTTQRMDEAKTLAVFQKFCGESETDRFGGGSASSPGTCSGTSIYTNTKAIAGEPWGTVSYSNLLNSSTDEIHIVYFDIDGNGSWGVLGFFWAANNYKQSALSFSNEALVFFMDAPTYGEARGTWDLGDAGPAKMLGTLAHEFQHMIHFYEKTVKRNVQSDTWINEMSSMTVEDLLAVAIGGTGSGPAADSWGRLSKHIVNPGCDLTTWYSGSAATSSCNVYNSYATALSFGAFMARHHNGAEFINDVLTTTNNGWNAITTGINGGESYQVWLARWGASLVMKGSKTYPTNYGYQQQGTSCSASGDTPCLQAIDVTGFSSPTKTYTTPPGEILPYSNVIWKLGSTSSKMTKTINVPSNVTVTVVAVPN